MPVSDTFLARLLGAASLALLTGCATAPTGPSVLVLPAAGKPFDSYRSDNAECRQFATEAVGQTTPNGAARESAVTSAAAGTAVGAAAGALFGAAAGNPAAGAAIGAGSGLLIGSAAGVGSYSASMATTQQQYDNAYLGCMYAKGNQIPVTSAAAPPPVVAAYPPPPFPAATIPPPPPPTSPGSASPPQFPPPPPGYAAATVPPPFLRPGT